jgi:hypothetical protein
VKVVIEDWKHNVSSCMVEFHPRWKHSHKAVPCPGLTVDLNTKISLKVHTKEFHHVAGFPMLRYQPYSIRVGLTANNETTRPRVL